MSANRQLFPAGAADGSAGSDTVSGPPAEMETLRRFVNDRLTAAVEEILGAFGETLARYREQIDRQRRQLDSLRPEDSKCLQAADPLQPSSWIKTCPDEDQILCVQLAQTDSIDEREESSSAAQIKTEVSEPSWNFDPSKGLEAESDVRLLADWFESEESGDCWREAAGLQKPEETEDTERRSSSTNKKFKSSAQLLHEQKSSDHLPPLLRCKVCGESFQRRSVLLNHAPVHLRDCGVCGKHLEDTETLKFHLRVHRETAFCCSICGQSFTLRGNLRTHMRIHSGERPYGCTVCGKSFGRRATLVRHVRSHTGEKPFICSYCGRAFIEKGNLTVHLRTHTGERPYWCSACDRRFSQLSCFYKHPCQRNLNSAQTNPT